MLNWISSQGWRIILYRDYVTVTKAEDVGNYPSIKAAYFALGGPLNSNLHNPKGLRP